MEDFNFLSFVLWFAVIWLALKFIQKYLEAKNEILREELEALEKKVKQAFIHVNIEKHGNIFYLFEKETDRFIAQGATMDELKLHCDGRFKDSTVIASNEDLEKSGLK